MAERERIARELHDTLLQGVQGLLLRFQSISNRVPSGDLRTSLEDALDRADAVLVEGRARVRDLRATGLEGDLAKMIVRKAHEAIDGDMPRFVLTVEGSVRPLHQLATEEACRIAEEAIRNAITHADAKTIEAILSYRASGLHLIVRDDGVGLPGSVLSAGERSGHYGLKGMRERAERVGGRLVISSRSDAGTEVVLTIPSRAAYSDRRSFFAWLRPARPTGDSK
jgi:signal transduction histidine kinase